MSIYGELYSMSEHRTQIAFRGKGEHIYKVNIPNIANPIQHFNTEIPHHGSRDYVLVPDIVKISLILTLNQHTKHAVLLTMQAEHY